MPKVRYTQSQGLTQQAGSGVQLDNLPYATVQGQTSNFTPTQPGAYTMSGSTATLITGTMPAASSVPGGLFVFRYTSADAHVLTGSAELAGTKVFKGIQSGSLAVADSGSKLQIAANIGNSVALLSDGRSFLVLNSNGALTFSGT